MGMEHLSLDGSIISRILTIITRKRDDLLDKLRLSKLVGKTTPDLSSQNSVKIPPIFNHQRI